MEFIEAPLFTKLIADYLDDDGYRELQLHLAHDPEAGDVIPGTGGFRKSVFLRRRSKERRKKEQAVRHEEEDSNGQEQKANESNKET